MVKNLLSIDLEDYFCDLPFNKWKKYDSRIEKTTDKILDLLDKYNHQATFFSLGYIGEKFPELIEKIIKKGHEIASHGYYHKDLRKISKEIFEEDLLKSIKTLEQISGEKILGFRAPFFSIDENNFEVFHIMKKYLKYDSSVFPVKTPLYGLPNAPRKIYKMNVDNPLIKNDEGDFLEIPLATIRIPIIGNIPIAGGFHLRFLPIKFLKFGINHLNKTGNVAMCYIHPKDLDPKMPHIPEYAWHYYWGLNSAAKKFEYLLKNFKFSSVRDSVSF
ncbi:polysaccharide deacetylase family protein [Nitrosopumilus piranensis]|uniref:Polysaccharide deactylase family protein, PEP-CTERM locus family protein n=1 Tax=Nitrosopumilus piranensis TaxID=1582439 RepID=A0A0C5BSK5_9ARCH|nr:polysaccharide deacetylase family protein [Nitrosopumilus piranensis]AJM91291.1 Polysaccharide deactylase family protein, PEP-CTERM locus family protein [Nitrosopumilus piranensis]